MTIINKDATLKVSHLLWAMGIFKVIIGCLTWFVLWYLSHDIDKAVSPLQTKQSFNEWKEKDKAEWNEWKETEWKPLIKETAKASVSIGILLDRTDSRARTTNSVGRNGMVAVPPPQ